MGIEPPPEVEGDDQNVIAGMLTARWRLSLDAGVSAELGFTLKLVPQSDGGPGLFVAPFGSVTVRQHFESWLLVFAITPGVGALLIKSGGVQFLAEGEAAPGRIQLSTALVKLGESGPAFQVGSTTGTRLEIGEFRIIGHGDFVVGSSDPDAHDFGLLIEVGAARIVVSPGEGDGFLQTVLPQEGLRTEFDLALGWSRRKGLYFGGSASLDATLPINQDLAGLLRVNSVYLSLRADGAGVRATTATTVDVQLGPVTAAVERFGLEALLTFPPDGGNLGVAELALTFKPPSGAALKIDAGVVVGGGYLFFDPANAQYAGAVQLKIGDRVSLAAFGLLTTRMPDGTPGFSLLVLMAARFDPAIALGYGFSLEGVGGLVGVNRTVAVDVLRAGLRAGTLGSVLFPEDPSATPRRSSATWRPSSPPPRAASSSAPSPGSPGARPPCSPWSWGSSSSCPAPVLLVSPRTLARAAARRETTRGAAPAGRARRDRLRERRRRPRRRALRVRGGRRSRSPGRWRCGPTSALARGSCWPSAASTPASPRPPASPPWSASRSAWPRGQSRGCAWRPTWPSPRIPSSSGRASTCT